MANQHQKQDYSRYSSDIGSLESFSDIRKLVEEGVEKDYLTFDELFFKLKRWWCQYYKRPYKDPLLDTYTLEELAFEYYDVTFDRSEKKDKVAEKIEEDDRAWAEEEDAREIAEYEAMVAAQQAEEAEKEAEPSSDMIVEEAIGLTDDQWANKVLHNPSADDINDGGDIKATFGE